MAQQIGQTRTFKNAHGFWTTESEFALPGERRVLRVNTSKRFSGATTTNFQAGTADGRMFTHAPFSGDVSIQRNHGKVRLTEKSCKELHAEALKEIDDMVTQAEKFRVKAEGL